MAEAEQFDDAQEHLDPSLASLMQSTTLRWIFVGGKGGVGKTTTACSLAIELAGRRESVLLLSTDPAHNISDALCQKFNNTPTKVNGFNNLFAMEIDASFNESQEFKLKQKDDAFGKMMEELVSAFPGVDEAMGFAELMQNVQTMPYSVVVFDTAPTGHTLRLLSFPKLLEKGLSKFGSMQSKFGGLLQMMQSMGGEVREEEMAMKVTKLQDASSSVRDIFQDPTRCTFVCVCIPEFLSVYETERLIQELCKHGIDSSNIVVNQVLFPEDCGEVPSDSGEEQCSVSADLEGLISKLNVLGLDPEQKEELCDAVRRAILKAYSLEKGWEMCQKKRRMQCKYLAQISDLYSDDFHVVAMPMLGDEVRGVDRLQGFAAMLRQGGRCLPLPPL